MFLFVTSLLSSVVIARLLGPEVLGMWILYNLISNQSEAFFRLKTDYAAVYYLERKKYDLASIIRALTFIACITSAMISIVIIIFQDELLLYLFKKDFQNSHLFLYIIILQIPLSFLYSNYIYLHIYKGDVKALNGMVLTRAIVSAVLNISFIYFLGLGLLGIILGSTLGICAGLIIGWYKLEKVGIPINKLDWKIYEDLLSFGAKVHAASVISHMVFFSGQIIIAIFAPPASVAFYTLGQTLSQYSEKFSNALNTFLFPKLSGVDDTYSSEIMTAKAFRILSFIMIIVGIVGISLIRFVVDFLYGTDYSQVAIIFCILLPSVAFYSAVSIIKTFFDSINRPDLNYKILVIPLVLQLLLNWLIINRYGIYGASFSFSLCLALSSCIYISIFVRKSETVTWKDMVFGIKDIKVLFSSLRNLF